MRIKAAMPGSECSVFFVVISVGQLSFKHIWLLAFFFFFFPIPANFGVWKTRGKTAALSQSFWVSLTNIVQAAQHHLAHCTGLLLSAKAKYFTWKSDGQFAPSGAIPKKHACVQGWIVNASSQNSNDLISENDGKHEPSDMGLSVIMVLTKSQK